MNEFSKFHVNFFGITLAWPKYNYRNILQLHVSKKMTIWNFIGREEWTGLNQICIHFTKIPTFPFRYRSPVKSLGKPNQSNELRFGFIECNFVFGIIAVTTKNAMIFGLLLNRLDLNKHLHQFRVLNRRRRIMLVNLFYTPKLSLSIH